MDRITTKLQSIQASIADMSLAELVIESAAINKYGRGLSSPHFRSIAYEVRDAVNAEWEARNDGKVARGYRLPTGAETGQAPPGED